MGTTLPVEGRVEVGLPRQRLGAAEVQPERGDAGEALEYGPGVAAGGLGVGGARVAADPEVGRVPGIRPALHQVVIGPAVLAREAEALRFALREVHVPDAVAGQVHGLPAFQEVADPGFRLLQRTV